MKDARYHSLHLARSIAGIPSTISCTRIPFHHSLSNSWQWPSPVYTTCYGCFPSSEYFHKKTHDLVREIPNCENISDNIWLWSKDLPTHLTHVEKLLTTLQVNGLTLKLPKCSFAQPEINVFGHTLHCVGQWNPT